MSNNWINLTDEPEGVPVGVKLGSPEHSAVCSIERHMSSMCRQETQYDGNYHPSQLKNMCFIEEYYKRISKEHIVNKKVFSKKAIMSMKAGTAIHDFFQNEILGPTGLLFGEWRCPCGEGFYYGNMRHDEECGFCGAASFKYIEPTIKNESLRIKGHSDGILTTNDKFILLEMKSKSDAEYEKATKANSGEKLQANIYARNINLNHYGVDEEISGIAFLFIRRSDWGDYRFSFEGLDPLLAYEYENKMKTVNENVENGIDIIKTDSDLRKCNCPETKRALNCKFKYLCWGED